MPMSQRASSSTTPTSTNRVIMTGFMALTSDEGKVPSQDDWRKACLMEFCRKTGISHGRSSMEVTDSRPLFGCHILWEQRGKLATWTHQVQERRMVPRTHVP